MFQKFFQYFKSTNIKLIAFVSIFLLLIVSFTNFKFADVPVLAKNNNISLREFIKNQVNETKKISDKQYSNINLQDKKDIEQYLQGLTRYDSTFVNRIINIPNVTVEQVFEFDDNKISNSENVLTLKVFENRITNYEDGQISQEKIPYDITWDTKNRKAIEIAEYSTSGNKIDKNKAKELVDIAKDKNQENAFFERFNNNKKNETEGIDSYRNSIPKDLESQKKFFKEKTDKLLDSEVLTNFNDNNLKITDPSVIETKAATSWNGYNAANYAKSNAYTDSPSGYSNYSAAGGDCTNFMSQAVTSGGLVHDYWNYDTVKKDWYFYWVGWQRVQSNTWSNASKNADHMYWHENTSIWKRVYPNDAAYILDIGDLIYINDNANNTHHVMMVTGAQWRSDLGYWDALYSQHESNQRDKSFTTGYNSEMASQNNSKFYGLKFYNNVWQGINS